MVNDQEHDNARPAADLKRRAQDFDDLQHEIAGRDVGRMTRFLPENPGDREKAEKRRADHASTVSRLQQLLRNPVYAALHHEAVMALADAQNRLDAALQRVQDALDQTDAALADMTDRAARTADG